MPRYDWSVPVGGPGLQPTRQPSLAADYHEASKLSRSVAFSQFAAQSALSALEIFLSSRGFRQYRVLPRRALPPAAASAVPLQEILRRRRSSRALSAPLPLVDLATLLQQALGPTALVDNVELGVQQTLRAWPSAGGLYPIDTYVIATNIEEIEPGAYHFNVLTSELERLQTRPVRDLLNEGFFRQDFVVEAAAVLVMVACFDRTMMKYGERGYRLVLLDAGHAAQNVLLTAAQLEVGAVAVGGFDDDRLAADLGIDGVSEAVVHAVAVGRAP